MTIRTRLPVLALALAAALAAPLALPVAGLAAEAGDAVFAERGPWDLGQTTLEWRMQVQGPDAEGFRPVADGRLSLRQIVDPTDDQPALQIAQDIGGASTRLGPFPLSSGDPVLTVFLERVVRDMAALTGGSPDYIRNRLKDALFRGGDLDHDGTVTTARFRPFADDANAARMAGFDSLELTFVMADPKAPIREMRAATDSPPGYDSHLVLQ